MSSNKLSDKTDYIIQQLSIVNDKLDRLHIEMETLNEKLNSVNSSCKNMDEHIGFVENVYDVVKSPFQKVLTYYYGSSEQKLLSDIKRT